MLGNCFQNPVGSSILKYSQKQKKLGFNSLKENQNERITSPSCFKTLKKPMVFMEKLTILWLVIFFCQKMKIMVVYTKTKILMI
jgi:hypothetical protein